MVSPSANVRRHFLTWDRPLLEQAVEWLAAGWQGPSPLDLSSCLVIVPTRQAGRRLREALAGFAGARGQAVFAPQVLTPDGLVAQELEAASASRLETLLAWTEVFRAIPLEEFRAVFPLDPPVRNFAWALRLAQQFTQLQATLAENGVALADVVRRAGSGFVEAERWTQLAALERRHAERLQVRGLRDPHEARMAAARRGLAAGNFDRIVLLAVPDPQALALERVTGLAAGRTVDVVVFAPASEAGSFDGWGRPIPAAWAQRVLALGDFESHVHLCADPAGQAARGAALAARYPAVDGTLAIAVADPEITPLLENELARSGRETFNPEGRAFAREALFELLSSLAALAREPVFPHVAALARCPDFFAYLRAEIGPTFSVAHWLEQLDELWARHLPPDLATATGLAVAAPARFGLAARGLEAMDRLRHELNAGSFATAAVAALRQIFSGRQLDLGRETDARWHVTAAAWAEVLRECAAAETRFGALPMADAWDLALRLFAEQRHTADKPVAALELAGWLEALWEDAAHLVVVGFNDGLVPEAVTEDPFLPESLRQTLGLRTNALRFARDAYLLQAIAACRAAAGRLDLFFGKTSTVGEPLRPSRLLLRCRDEDLPARIGFLFRAPELAEGNTAWMRAWRLTPRRAPPPKTVAVTALRSYLQCPFRFYLRHVLVMQPIDAMKNELDARDFGTLCHGALERIGRDPALRDCTDPARLRAELLAQLDATVRTRYGPILSLPLLVQVESARQRIGRLAELQAEERAAGWEILHVERAFEIEIAGLTIRGKIDRIDRQRDTGAIRVLDYKTSDVPVTPAEAHLRTLRATDEVPEWARYEDSERPRAWIDLQLPLYLQALAAEFPGRISGGYFNLPKAAGETALVLWEGYTPDLHAAAMRCAAGACTAIRAGEFWPPNETVRAERDECAALFHQGVATSVAWISGGAAP